MAPNDKEMMAGDEFEQAFNDQSAPAAPEGDGFGLMPGEEAEHGDMGTMAGEAASEDTGEPAAVVIVTDEEAGPGEAAEPGAAETEEEADNAAAAEAKAVADEHNDKAGAHSGSPSTATEEAAASSHGGHAAEGEQSEFAKSFGEDGAAAGHSGHAAAQGAGKMAMGSKKMGAGGGKAHDGMAGATQSAGDDKHNDKAGAHAGSVGTATKESTQASHGGHGSGGVGSGEKSSGKHGGSSKGGDSMASIDSMSSAPAGSPAGAHAVAKQGGSAGATPAASPGGMGDMGDMKTGAAAASDAGGMAADMPGRSRPSMRAGNAAAGETDAAMDMGAMADMGSGPADNGTMADMGGAADGGMEMAGDKGLEGDMGDMNMDDFSDVPPEDMQKAKSWVGRLKKIEADLKSRAGHSSMGGAEPGSKEMQGEMTVDAMEQVASRAPDMKMAEAADAMADQVAAGEMSPHAAMAALAEDFGEPFVRMIEMIASSAAGKAAEDRVSRVSQDVQSVIDHITNERERQHFETIYGAHQDFMEVAEDPAFKEFVASTGKQSVVDGGSAAEIVDLLSAYKASAAPAGEGEKGGESQAGAQMAATPAQDAATAAEDAVSEDDMDAAEGVRSAGLRLPEEPKQGSDDFESAWKEFA
jgi:hypothetical protein